jgi:hypothetical protein
MATDPLIAPHITLLARAAEDESLGAGPLPVIREANHLNLAGTAWAGFATPIHLFPGHGPNGRTRLSNIEETCSMSMVTPDKEVLATVGRCIYCGGPGETEEHLIPLALSGVHTLAKASCRACATKSSQFELRLLRGPLLPARVALALFTRDPKTRPSTFPTRFTLKDGSEVTEEVPVTAHPSFLSLPVLAPPTRLYEGRADDTVRVLPGGWARQFTDPDEVNRYARERGAREATWTSTVPAAALAQLVGKIALGFAVADLGADGFDRTIPNPLDATLEELGPFVGGNAVLSPPEEDLHVVHVSVFPGGKVGVTVRLFARFGAPTYIAVVGSARDATARGVRHGTVITGGYTLRGFDLPANAEQTLRIVPDRGKNPPASQPKGDIALATPYPTGDGAGEA